MSKEPEMVWVTIPPQTDPALMGKGMLRKPGPRRSRQYETPDEIMSGIQGQPIPQRPKFGPDYFLEGEPELVELDRWVMRKLIHGSLVRVCGPGKRPVAPPSEPGKLTLEERDALFTSAMAPTVVPDASKLFNTEDATPDAVEPNKE